MTYSIEINAVGVNPDCYVFDLDGTLFDCSPRDHLIPKEPATTDDWTEWNQACHLDKVIEHVAIIAKSLAASGNRIRYVTSRCEDGMIETIKTITDSGLPFGYLHMRSIGDNRSHVDVKIDLFNELSKTFNIIAAFDDQQDNIDALSALGFTMIKV
jgi:predicted secreted acid phosphatase